ncbi:hypothetical protein AAW14_09360 [Streptomyces hygroscopicus]|uniref:ABC transporter n=1 Tax=Streptomyces hygroscopicus TaxID=1912 RepID=UPI002240B4AA|nr:ABC transporter [Streptomyces hygroscopicus]MCW7942254.1 hypothetical protein [Streptomyces hygroscopicus]
MPEVGAAYARVRALLPPLWRALPWRVLGAAGGSATALPALARLVSGGHDTAFALILLRSAEVALALGLAFLLDDPARHITVAVPTRRVLRNGLRLALVVPLVLLCWTVALLLVPGEIRPPAGDVGLEAAALAALALTGAAAAVRFTDEPQPGAVVAATLLAVTVLETLLPERCTLFVDVADPGWAAAHQRWAVLLLLTVPMGAALLPERIRRRRALAWTHR